MPGIGDEIASLAVTINRLLDRLQRALARQRGFVADAGHELRAPLTALKAALGLAARPGKSRADMPGTESRKTQPGKTENKTRKI
ncbi:MAG: hypothetical protein ACTHKL_21325 [Streptosporangiaceae bacterium]